MLEMDVRYKWRVTPPNTHCSLFPIGFFVFLCFHSFLVSVLFTGQSLLVVKFYRKFFTPSTMWDEDKVEVIQRYTALFIALHTSTFRPCWASSQTCGTELSTELSTELTTISLRRRPAWAKHRRIKCGKQAVHLCMTSTLSLSYIIYMPC